MYRERIRDILKSCSMLPAVLGAVVLYGCTGLAPHQAGSGGEGAGLSHGVLRAQQRDTERLVTELRVELAATRKELAAAQVMRAQLQGHLRESERRYAQAHQVVSLQREELVRLRRERAAVLETSGELQSQMRQLRERLVEVVGLRERRLGGTGGKPVRRRGHGVSGSASSGSKQNLDESRQATRSVVHVSSRRTGSPSGKEAGLNASAVVYVRRGDTLSQIAQRYAVELSVLAELNDLGQNPDLIYPGQMLRLPPKR